MEHITGHRCVEENIVFKFKETWEQCTAMNIRVNDTVRNNSDNTVRGVVRYIIGDVNVHRFIVQFECTEGECIRDIDEYERLVS